MSRPQPKLINHRLLSRSSDRRGTNRGSNRGNLTYKICIGHVKSFFSENFISWTWLLVIFFSKFWFFWKFKNFEGSGWYRPRVMVTRVSFWVAGRARLRQILRLEIESEWRKITTRTLVVKTVFSTFELWRVRQKP